MKRKIVALAAAVALSAPAMAEEKGTCRDDIIKDSPNPIVGLVTIPFKVVVVLTHLPRCIVENIPTNE